jgi:ABC-2 type transport system permease protein
MTMRLHRCAAIMLRQFYLLRGSLSRFLPLFLWPAIDITLWGFITKYFNTLTARGVSFSSSLVGAVLMWDFFIRTMQGVTMGFFEDVWSRNFLNLFATPLSIAEYLSGLVLSSILTCSLSLAVMVSVATIAFGFSFHVYGVMLVGFFLVLFACGIAFGIVSIGVVLRLGSAAEWLVWTIPAIISPFVGVFYPLSTLPRWMRYISYLLPPSYVFEGMRSVILDRSIPWRGLLAGTGVSLLYILLACSYSIYEFRRAIRCGIIARYSTET